MIVGIIFAALVVFVLGFTAFLWIGIRAMCPTDKYKVKYEMRRIASEAKHAERQARIREKLAAR